MIGEYVAPSLKVIENSFDYCDDLIIMAKEAPKDAWVQSGVESHASGEALYNTEVRRSREISITYELDRPRIFFDVAQTIYRHTREYCLENEVSFSHMESVHLIEYAPNQGFFDRHTDAGPSSPRSVSAILYLNDVESGGETWFDKFSISLQPKRGRLVIFPSNYAYSHQALPPISGYKYIAVTWFGTSLDRNIFERYYP